MLWLKVAIPVLMAATGVGAVVVTSQSDGAPATASQVWIDSPLGEVAFGPGDVAVAAHATADDSITALQLFVDDEKVASDTSLDRSERLVYGQFTWKAPVGEHDLVVRQVGGTGDSSDVLRVVVVDGAPPAPTTTIPGSTTTTAPGETTTTVDGSTTTSSTTSTTVPPEGNDTTPATLVPTTAPPAPTTTRAPSPAVTEAYFTGSSQVYQIAGCPYTANVTASTRNTSRATLSVSGTGFSTGMNKSGDTFTASIPSGFTPGEVGSHTVVISALGPGGSTTYTVGTLVIRAGCPKD